MWFTKYHTNAIGRLALGKTGRASSTMHQIPLSAIVPLHRGVVSRQGDTVVVITDPEQWAYSAHAVFGMPGIQQAHEAQIIKIRLKVENGIFGIGLLRQDELDWVARVSATPTDEVVERHLVIPAGTAGRRLIFENWSPDGMPARAVIYDIDATATNSESLCHRALEAETRGDRETASSLYKGALTLDRNCITATAGIARLAARGVVSLNEDLWPLPEPEFSVANLRTWSEATLQSNFTGDALRDNLILNKWEFATGKTVLRSFPWRLSVPFAMCNAQCEFCAAWSVKGNIRLDDLIESLIPVVRHCYNLDLVGWGEPLIHPQFSTIVDILKREADPRARLSLSTNGTRLDEWIDRLLDANVMWYAISIHAATSATHQDLMGLGPEDFERVVGAVRKLIARKAEFPRMNVELVLVVTQQNIAEIPAFIEMGEQLGVDQVYLKTLMPQDEPREELDYHRLPPYRHPQFEQLSQFAIAALSRSRVPVKGDPASWSTPLFLPEWEDRLDTLPLTPRQGRKYHRFSPPTESEWDALSTGQASDQSEPCHVGANLYDRSAPLYCPSPYTAFYVNATYRKVIPCVYMHEVPGYTYTHFKPSTSFEEVWNSPAMVAVRRSLNEGPLMPECLKCPFHCG